MKCLVINGSPSTRYDWDGKIIPAFTMQLVNEIQAEMSKLGKITFDEVRLADWDISHCKGCYNCFYKGESTCFAADAIQPIVDKMREADCLILTSPVYALHVSGLIKSFFDFTAYNFHRPSFFEKKALVVSSTAGAGATTACKYMKDVLGNWGFNRVFSLAVARRAAQAPTEHMKKKCKSIATKLYADTASGRLHSPSFKQVALYQAWQVMSGKNPQSVDGTYWRENNLVGHTYSPNVKVGSVKKMFGAMMRTLMKKVM